MAARASMKVPTKSSRMLISSRMRILFSVSPRMARATVPGTSSMVMMFPNRVAMAMSTIITEDVSHDSTQASTICRRFISR